MNAQNSKHAKEIKASKAELKAFCHIRKIKNSPFK